MLRAQQIINSLYGVKGTQGNLYHQRIPVTHGTIPKSRQLQSLQLPATLALVRNEACSRIHIVRKIKLIALIVTHSTNQVHRIEVCTLCEHLHVLGIILVDLTAFQNLQRNTTVRIISQERTATGFADILYDTAHTDGAIQLVLQEYMQFGILHILKSGNIGIQRMT